MERLTAKAVVNAAGEDTLVALHSEGIDFSYRISTRGLISNQTTLYIIPSQVQESFQTTMNNMLHMQNTVSLPVN